VEFLTWSVGVSTKQHERSLQKKPRDIKTSSKRFSSVFDPVKGRLEKVPSYARSALPARLKGPALIVEPQTTTLLPRGWRCGVTRAGHLLLENVE
jgi:hypothetical protein